MNESKPGGGGGLAGVVAGRSAIATVGRAGRSLSYRGYAIEELAKSAGFEEVAYLLIHGELPRAGKLAAYRERLRARRELPEAVCEILKKLPASAHPMDVLRTGCSALGAVTPIDDPAMMPDAADVLLAQLPAVIGCWRGSAPDPVAESHAAYTLAQLGVQAVTDEAAAVLDVAMTLYAEHEFNASTFAARIAASTFTDFHSAVTAAIATLRGPLHGGANEAALDLIRCFDDPQAAEAGITRMLAERKLIMGFGHRVYRGGDPRSPIIEAWAQRLAESSGSGSELLSIARSIEAVMRREKGLFPNLDFYSAVVFDQLGIEQQLFTPVFVIARLTGWAAHIIEQLGDNKLIRPTSEYIGPDERPFVPLSER